MKISVILGTRPEGIKLAPVILALKGDPAISCRVCVTGQHREMLDQVLKVFEIKPDADLHLMRSNQTLADLTGRGIQAVDSYLAVEEPDLVLVQGDTTTVLCATLGGFYRHVPVGHVEAGLRTGNLQSPWPEEANRVLTTRLATLHFAPTETNRQNLLHEGVLPEKVFVTGNTVIDALFFALRKVRENPPEIPGLPPFLQPSNSQPSTLNPQLVLITGHRRENFGEGFENICRAIADLARRFPNTHFVYPVHLNPSVREPVQRILGHNGSKTCNACNNIHLIEPVPYLPFVALMDQAKLILTDSGGVQEEAPSLGTPVLVMRDTTERPEAVAAGTVKLVGTSRATIIEAVNRLLTDAKEHSRMARTINPYGDGNSAARIKDTCVEWLCREQTMPITRQTEPQPVTAQR